MVAPAPAVATPPATGAQATYADVLAAPPHQIAELIDGVLHVQPRPAPRHLLAGSSLGGELGGPFQRGRGGPGGWWILDGAEVHLGAHVIAPDLAGWRRARMPDLPQAAYFTLAPDWVCEILSPGTAALDRGRKRALYLEAGVETLWLIDPADTVLEVFRRQDGAWVLHATLTGDATVQAPPFGAVAFPLTALWGTAPPADDNTPDWGGPD